MVRKVTTGTGQNRVRLPYNKLAPTPEEGNDKEGESTEEVKARREAREARFQRKTIGYGKQTEPPRKPLRGAGDLRVMSDEEYATRAASRKSSQDIPEGSGHPQDSQSGPQGAAEKKNYGPAFYAAWAQSRKAYQKEHRRRSASDSPVPLPHPSSPLPPKRQARDDRPVPKTSPELLPEWLSNVHLNAGGEQWHRPNLFRSGAPVQDDGKTVEKMSLEAPTKMAKNPGNARDGEGQPQANTMAFDKIPTTALKETPEGHRGTQGDEVQSQNDSDTRTFLKTAPKAPRKMPETKALREEMTYAPGKHDLPDSSTSRTSATDMQTQPALYVPLAAKLENSSGHHVYAEEMYSERCLEKLTEKKEHTTVSVHRSQKSARNPPAPMPLLGSRYDDSWRPEDGVTEDRRRNRSFSPAKSPPKPSASKRRGRRRGSGWQPPRSLSPDSERAYYKERRERPDYEERRRYRRRRREQRRRDETMKREHDSYVPTRDEDHDPSRGRRPDRWSRSLSPIPERAYSGELREDDRRDRAWKREDDSYVPRYGERDRSQDERRGRSRSPYERRQG